MLDPKFKAQIALEQVYSGIPPGPRRDRIIKFISKLMDHGVEGSTAATMLAYTYVAGMTHVTDKLTEDMKNV